MKKKPARKADPAKVPQDIADSIRTRDLENIAAKAAAGDPLTDAQLKRLERGTDKDDFFLPDQATLTNAVGISRIVGLTEARILQLHREEVLKRDKKTKLFPLIATIRDFIARKTAQTGRSALEEARTKEAEAGAALKQAQRLKLEGTLADVDDLAEATESLFSAIEKIVTGSQLPDEAKMDIFGAIKDHVKKWARR